MRCNGNCSERLWALAGGGPPPPEKQFFTFCLSTNALNRIHPLSALKPLPETLLRVIMVFSNPMLSLRCNVVI